MIIDLIGGVLVCLLIEFVERVLKIDDPVGAVSVHGANGLWGVIAVGLFADGKSNYGGAWNGVSGSVTGLFYGDASQLVAQLVGVSALLGKDSTCRKWARWAIPNSNSRRRRSEGNSCLPQPYN